jgi:hypothetical protein
VPLESWDRAADPKVFPRCGTGVSASHVELPQRRSGSKGSYDIAPLKLLRSKSQSQFTGHEPQFTALQMIISARQELNTVNAYLIIIRPTGQQKVASWSTSEAV